MGYDRILVPPDGSHLAEYILPQVKATAHAFNAEVMFLQVIDEPAREGDGGCLHRRRRGPTSPGISRT